MPSPAAHPDEAPGSPRPGQARIGLLGGSFDPPHLAHLALARLAVAQLQLDELRWMPAAQPWQKQGRAMSAPEHRAAMVRALIAGEPRQTLDQRELQRGGVTYTVETLRGCVRDQPTACWYLVIGQDQYGRFDTWRDWREILGLVTLAVAGREGQAPQPPAVVAAVPHRIAVLNLPRMDVSASEIRTRCALGQPIASLVGEAVAGYIDRHALYRGTPRS